MLSDKARAREIERRKRGGSLSIPNPREGEVLSRFYKTDRLYGISQYGIYQVFTSEDIDPEITAENVPWAINRYFAFGLENHVFSYFLGMIENVCSVIVSQDDQDKLRELSFPCLASLNELAFAESMFRKEWDATVADLDSKKISDLIDGSGVHLPSIGTFEVSFSLFVRGLKNVFTNLFAVCEWACGLEVGKGARLDKLLNRIRSNKKLVQKFEDLEFISRHESFVEDMNKLRNAFEHPTRQNLIQLRNVSLTPDRQLLGPSFRHVTNEEYNSSIWFDYSANLTSLLKLTLAVIRDALMLVAIAKDEGFLAWDVFPLTDKLQGIYQVDCEFRIVGILTRSPEK